MPRGVRLRVGVGAGVVLLLVALLIAVAVSALAPHGSTRTVTAVTAASGAGDSSTAGTGAAATDRPVTPLFVHVLGAVHNPGLFQLHDGARVVDAVAAAGGFTEDAEQAGVNLARRVADGEQLVVPRIGENPPVVAQDAGGAPAAGGSAASGAKININTATTEQLEVLPRVGPALAKRIVDWRTANGRFSTVDDLMSVTGIGQKTFDGLKDQVTV